MRRFKFQVSVGGKEVSEGIIDLDQSVIDQANSKEFRRYFHTFRDDNQIAAHIAYNMIVNKSALPEIEGFMMPRPRGLAKIVEYPEGFDLFEFDAKEVA
jgi:hypothetical protein